jgi:hypothetical protein
MFLSNDIRPYIFNVVNGLTNVTNRVTGWMDVVRFPAGKREFSVLDSVQTGSGSPRNFLSKVYGGALSP